MVGDDSLAVGELYMLLLLLLLQLIVVTLIIPFEFELLALFRFPLLFVELATVDGLTGVNIILLDCSDSLYRFVLVVVDDEVVVLLVLLLLLLLVFET